MNDHALLLTETQEVTIVTGDDQLLLIESAELVLVESGAGGVPGAKGDPGTSTITLTANIALGGHRVIKVLPNERATYADNTDAMCHILSIGVSLGAAIQDADVEVQTFGYMSDVSFSFTANARIYLGINGLMTQVAPVSPAFVRVIGYAISATEVWIDPQPAIIQV